MADVLEEAVGAGDGVWGDGDAPAGGAFAGSEQEADCRNRTAGKCHRRLGPSGPIPVFDQARKSEAEVGDAAVVEGCVERFSTVEGGRVERDADIEAWSQHPDVFAEPSQAFAALALEG